MKASYPLALKKVLEYEGGFVDHPKDPGGATNKGITQGTYNGWRSRQGLPAQTVRRITDAEVQAIYRRDYWDKVRGDDLPVGVDLAVFDFAVNSGVSRAVRFVQQLAGVTADGIIGPNTLAAINAAQAGLVDRLCDARLSFLKSLKTWPTFGRGWSRRVASVRSVSKSMRKAYADLSK
jgi:lysozyme family protein